MRMRLSLVLLVSSVASLAVALNVTDYAPYTNVACPNVTVNPLLRIFEPSNQSLHPAEQNYVTSRATHVVPSAWLDWIGDGSAIGYNSSVFAGNWSTVGISISGGGYRAAQYGAGVLSGLDARNQSSKDAGTGGLLQVTSYLSGLSGGSWLTGSLYLNNWPTIHDLVLGNGNGLEGWLLDLNLATPGGFNIFSQENQWFYGSLLWSVYAKADAGIDTSITDPWARTISYHFLNQTTRDNFFTNQSSHGAGQLWSQIPQTDSFQQKVAPFPIVIACSRPAGSNVTTALGPEPVVYEITPLEFGSYDPNLSAMVNITYAGTHLTNGVPPNDTGCVTGFDEAGFMMGTSASLFNQILDFAHNKLAGFINSDAEAFLHLLSRQLSQVRTRADDVANWPNPFHGLKPNVFEDSNSTWLELIDGASNLENVPLGPMFVRARNVDFVVAVDGSANTPQGWPNGTSPIFTAKRLKQILTASHQSFPPIPDDPSAWVSMGINARPTLFGCDPTTSPPQYPLVLYLPNAPPVNGDDPVTNTATFSLRYTPKHTSLFLDQAHLNTVSGFVPSALGADSSWGKCLQCAAVDRARLKLTPPQPRSNFCSKCFLQYCFDPSSPPSQKEIVGRKLDFKDPDPQGSLKGTVSFISSIKGVLIGAFVALFALIGISAALYLVWKKRKNTKGKYQRMPSTAEDDAIWSASQPPRSYELPEQHGEHTSGRSSPHESERRMLRVQETADTYVVPTLGYSKPDH